MPGFPLPYRLAWSYKICKVFGIDIKVHVIFVAMILFFSLQTAWMSKSWIVGAINLGLLLLLFLFVVLHELGHSLAAKALGIRVIDITLWPLGGMARLAEIPEEPSVELRVAMAGPAVNFAIILLAIIPEFLLGGPERLGEIQQGLVLIFTNRGFPLDFTVIVLAINAALGTINLVPAFPLDGGRILRALMARRMPYLKATELAVKIGKYLALAGIIMLAWNGELLSPQTLICLFIVWAGSSELRAARTREFIRAAKRGYGPFANARWAAGPADTTANGTPSPGRDGALEADVVDASWPDEQDAQGPADKESGRYRDLPEKELERHLDAFSQDFLKLVDKYKKKDR